MRIGQINFVKGYDIGMDTFSYAFWMDGKEAAARIFSISDLVVDVDRWEMLMCQRLEYIELNTPPGKTNPWTKEEQDSGSYRTGIWSQENTDFLAGKIQ